MAQLVTPLSYRGCLARTRDELRRVNSMARGTTRVSIARNNHFSFPESSEAGNMDSALCLKLSLISIFNAVFKSFLIISGGGKD